jgi:hypothetical protein
MKDLTQFIQNVFKASTLSEKKEAMLSLIDESRAKSDTKAKARIEVGKIKSAVKMDSFAFNYMASGEGMKVR